MSVIEVELTPQLLGDAPERFVARSAARILAELRRAAAKSGGAAGPDAWRPVTVVLRAGGQAPEPFVVALFEAARGLAQVATLERIGVRCNVLLAGDGPDAADDVARSVAFLDSSQAAFVTGVSLDLRAAS